MPGVVYVIAATHQVWGANGFVEGEILVDHGLKITGDMAE